MEWRTIDSAPKDGSRVLVFSNRKFWTETAIARWIGSPHNHWSIDGFKWLDDVTHWMPLPTPPQSGK